MTVEITVGDRFDALQTVTGLPKTSAMRAIRDAGSDELLAISGGCCSCLTRHVYAEAGRSTLPAMSRFEEGPLDSSLYREPSALLSRQLPLASSGLGLRVRIPAEQ